MSDPTMRLQAKHYPRLKPNGIMERKFEQKNQSRNVLGGLRNKYIEENQLRELSMVIMIHRLEQSY